MKSFLLGLVLFVSVSFKPAGNAFICISKAQKHITQVKPAAE